MTTKTLVLGRTPARVRAVPATLREDGFAAESTSTDEEARGLLASGQFGVLIVGGGVGRESRAAMKEGTTGSSSARAGAPRARRTGGRSHRSSAPTCRPAYGADPPPEVLAPVHDVAGLGRQRVAGLQVEPDEESMSSVCSRRSSDSAPADETGRPSARRCSISAALRAAAPPRSSARSRPGSPGRWRSAGPEDGPPRPPTRAPPRDLSPTRRRSADRPCPASPAGRRGLRPCRYGRRSAGCRRSTARGGQLASEADHPSASTAMQPWPGTRWAKGTC